MLSVSVNEDLVMRTCLIYFFFFFFFGRLLSIFVILIVVVQLIQKRDFRKKCSFNFFMAQSAGAAEYTDCITEEGVRLNQRVS